VTRGSGSGEPRGVGGYVGSFLVMLKDRGGNEEVRRAVAAAGA
jgi:hypothetical protein